jgi:hypothetical protein
MAAQEQSKHAVLVPAQCIVQNNQVMVSVKAVVRRAHPSKARPALSLELKLQSLAVM